MLLQVGRHNETEGMRMLLGTDRFEKAKVYYQIANREYFLNVESELKYYGTLPQFPFKSFAFIYLRPVDVINKQFLMKARTMCTKGIILNSTSVPSEMERLIFKFSEIKRANKAYDDLKEINDKIEDKYKSAKKEIKALNKIAREKNKELEKEWKKEKKEMKKEFDDVLEKMSDEQKKFMPKEPDYPDEPKYIKLETEPPEPRLRDLPRSVSIHIGENQLHKVFGVAWSVLSSFDLYQIEGTNHSVLVKKEESLKYTYDNLDSLDIDKKMSKEDFITLFDKFERNEKSLESFRPVVSTNYEFMDLLAENRSYFEGSDWVFSEEDRIAAEDEMLPSLAPIKPMHAASILSGGLKFSKEIETEDGYVLIKSAPIKIFTEKVKIMNGKKVTEVYQQRETKLSIYNLNNRTLEVY